MRTTKRITLLSALAFIQLLFIQCSPQNNEATTTDVDAKAVESVAIASQTQTPVCNIKIAYVDYDSLLINYNFAQDVQKELLRKEMSINNIIETERKSLQEEAATLLQSQTLPSNKPNYLCGGQNCLHTLKFSHKFPFS